MRYPFPADQVSGLVDKDSDVSFVSPDRDVKSTSDTEAFYAVSCDLVQATGLTGKGVTVAVVDSGIGKTDDLAKDAWGATRLLYSQDFTAQGTDDQYGHGTHVAGIIGGSGKKSTCSACFLTYQGLASNVDFVNLKALDRDGNGKDSHACDTRCRAQTRAQNGRQQQGCANGAARAAVDRGREMTLTDPRETRIHFGI